MLVKTPMRYLIPYAFSIIAVWLLTLLYIEREQFWYFWDYKGFWDQYSTLIIYFETDIKSFISTIKDSITSSDYNVTPVVVPAILSSYLDAFIENKRTKSTNFIDNDFTEILFRKNP